MNPDFEKVKKALALLRRILVTICTLIALAGGLMLARSAVNALFLQLYSTGHFYMIPENLLVYLPFGENYVAPYNLGNAAFHNGDYEKAIYYYTLAWQNNPPDHPEHDEECKIRVNLAFTMCHTIDFDNLDLSDAEAVGEAVATLQQARAILTEEGCASEPVGSSDGHYADADKLRRDIDEMLEKLQSQSSQDEDGSGGGGQDENNNSGGQDEDQNQDQSEDQGQQDSQSKKSKSQQEKEKAERARQEQLKEDLEQQKEDLKDTHSSSSYDYEYIDSGDAQGYGDGTLW